MKKVQAFKEDMAPQMILLMGLPAAGKSTFVKTNLIKFYNHRMPHLTSMQVLNSDVQLRRMQYERAREDFDRLQGLEKDAYEAVTKDMRYESNEGKEITFTLPYEQFVGMQFNDFFKRMYKEYYATFFGDRGKAKKSTDELALKKIKGGDVVILDSVGTTTDKMLKYFEIGKKQGYTTSVVFLEIDPDISIARDLYRGQTEGRSVGEGVIRSYEPKLKPAWQTYFKSPMVDRLLHFRWIPASPTDVVKGKYKLVKDLKRYGAGRGTKPAAEPQAASVKTTAANPMGKGQQKVSLAKTRDDLRRAVIGTLLRAGRRDLAQAVAAHHRSVKKKSVQAARKLDSRTRQQVNADLSKAGLDGNGRFRKIGEALNVIAKVLNRHGIQQDQVFSANLFRDDHGQRTFDVAFSNPSDSFSPESIGNSMLVIQWQQLRPDTFEVLSYLS